MWKDLHCISVCCLSSSYLFILFHSLVVSLTDSLFHYFSLLLCCTHVFLCLCHLFFSAILPPRLTIFPSLCLLISPSVSLGPLPSTRPWDPLNDLIQFEKDGCIQTKVRHRTPMVRSGSLISLSNQGPRRDNCKCQVGRPDRKPPFLSSSPPQPPSTQHPVQRLHCRFFSLCRRRCAAIAVVASAPFLSFFSFSLSLFFCSFPALAPAVLSVWEERLFQIAC